MANVIGDIVKNGYESGKELLDEYRIKPEDYHKKQNKEQLLGEHAQKSITSQTSQDKDQGNRFYPSSTSSLVNYIKYADGKLLHPTIKRFRHSCIFSDFCYYLGMWDSFT
ncbi:hypothetical protein [Gaoshiqia sp. Z1-71]|uniref:hypothetical protein n=1 Tax=Gaoshiqia hydrogeniformans TaxID=3290090 RepID=UPI003BF89A53